MTSVGSTKPLVLAGLYLLFGAPLAIVVSGCEESDSTTDDGLLDTAVTLDPADFLGDLPCGIRGGAVHYTAALFEVESNKSAGRIERADCATPALFPGVTDGLTYRAELTVFDDQGDAAWETTCGDPTGAAKAVAGRQVAMAGCAPFDPIGTAETSLWIDTTTLAGALSCTSDGGLIHALTIHPSEGMSLEPTALECGPDAQIFGNFSAGDEVHFHVLAEDMAFEQAWGATCTGRLREGFGVPVICSSLTERASVIVPITEVVAASELACGTDIDAVVLRRTSGGETDQIIAECDADVTFPSEPHGAFEVEVRLLSKGAVEARFECAADAPPGAVTTAACQAL